MTEDAERRLHRLLTRDLGSVVKKTGRGTWTTTSNLPHEIQLHTVSAVELVRVSAGMIIGVKPSAALLRDLNALRVERAFTRRIIVDGKVMVVAEMPVASLRKGDIEHLVSTVFCLARLDAPLLSVHGGRSVSEPPPAVAPDLDTQATSWPELLRASGTATARELAVWIDGLVGCDCWIERDDSSVFVVVDGRGIGSEYPFRLGELPRDAQELMDTDEDEDEDEDEDWDEEGCSP